MPSNEELERWVLAVAQEADRQAFARLFSHYAPRVKGFMLRAGCSPELAEDVAQEALVAVWRKAGLFKPGQASVSTWVFTIARNLRIDLHRRHAAQGGATTASELDLERLEDAPAPASSAPDELVLSEQRIERVREAMAQLPAEQAVVVRLSFFEEHAHAEIARTLNLPLGTVKSRIRLAVGQLRRLLGDFE